MWNIKPNPPFKVTPGFDWDPGEKERKELERTAIHEDWSERIKAEARANLANSFERLRIEWTARYKIPRHPRFEDYTPEEILLEAWETFYLENPEHLEMKGIHKRADAKTGYTYYETGDPLIDELEKAFARGEVPDLNTAFADVKPGPDIFRMPVFVDKDGNKVAALQAGEGLVSDENGVKRTAAGNRVEHTDFTTDAWLDDAFGEDPALKLMAEKMGVKRDA